MAKCPKCEKMISQVRLSDVAVLGRGPINWHGISYDCPFCQTSLSVSIDPVALKTDVVSEVTRAVKKLLGRP